LTTAHNIIGKVKGKDSIDCTDTLYNIGLVYNYLGRPNLALEYFEKVKKIFDKTGVCKKATAYSKTVKRIEMLAWRQDQQASKFLTGLKKIKKDCGLI
jgi:hypothetical protein